MFLYRNYHDKSDEGVSVINRVIEEGTHLKKGKVHCNYMEERDELLERIFEKNGQDLDYGTYTLYIVRHGKWSSQFSHSHKNNR